MRYWSWGVFGILFLSVAVAQFYGGQTVWGYAFGLLAVGNFGRAEWERRKN